MKSAWKIAVWVINKKYKGKAASRFINNIDSVISTRK